MKTILSLLLIVVLAIAACYFFRKLVESIINLKIYLAAKKDPHHPARVEGGIVYNSETKKLEKAEDKIILPF